MNKQDCFNLGFVSKTVGLDGDVVLFLDVDQPDNYSEMGSVFIEINDNLVPFFIDEISITKKTYARVKLDGIDSERDAMNLVKKQLFLPLEVLPKLEGKNFYFHEIEGFDLIDQNHEKVGPVEDLLDYPNNLLFKTSYKGNEIFIPANDDVIVEVNRSSKQIIVQLPEGLLDIYLTSSEDEEDKDE